MMQMLGVAVLMAIVGAILVGYDYWTGKNKHGH